MALLQVAQLLDPDDLPIWCRHQRFAKLADAASLGFLLLVPLQISAGLRLQGTGSSQALGRIERAEHQLALLRQAIVQYGSPADQSARFQALNGPGLSPADPAMPLPLLKAQAGAAFDKDQAQIARARADLPVSNPLRLLPEQLRSAASCLVLAFGFAIFAQWPGSEISMPEEF